MCELCGISCQQPDGALHSLSSCKEFSENNPDGWGIGYYLDGIAKVEKDPQRADSSEKFNDIITQVCHYQKYMCSS
jgi:predicted glutamine amidotransferase